MISIRSLEELVVKGSHWGVVRCRGVGDILIFHYQVLAVGVRRWVDGWEGLYTCLEKLYGF